MFPPSLSNEAERLAALKRYYILDTPPEAAFDRITALAARLFSVPISLVSLVDEIRHWFKSAYGLEIQETSRDVAFCAHTIASEGVMVVPDATADPMDELELRFVTIQAARGQEHQRQSSRQLADLTGKLRLSEETLEKVLEALPIGVWVADKEGNILHGNPAGQAIWAGCAYVPIERYGEYVAWWPETGQRVRAEDWALARAIRRGETSVGEVIRIQAFDGTQKTILNSAVPLRDESGAIVGAVVVNEDVTGQRRREEALRGTRDQLDVLIQASPLAIISLDREGVVLSWNQAAEQIFGWRAGEVLRRSCPIVPEVARVEYEEQCARMLRGEQVNDFETVRRKKDGTLIDVTVSAGALHGPSGEVTGIIALLSDTTAKKAADRALRESEERYRSLVELSPSAIVVHAQGRVVFVNPAAVQMFGATHPGEILGRDPTQFAHPECLSLFRERTRSVIEEGKAQPLIEVKLLRLDRTVFYGEVISIPTCFEGRPAVQIVIRDISARKEAEFQAREHERNLAALVDNLTKTILANAGYRVIEAANGGAALLACGQYAGTISLLITDVIMPGMSGRELRGHLAPLCPKIEGAVHVGLH